MRYVCNRGASGIDGVLSAAIGYAVATTAPVTVLIGDLATIHDLNALVLLRSLVPGSMICYDVLFESQTIATPRTLLRDSFSPLKNVP